MLKDLKKSSNSISIVTKALLLEDLAEKFELGDVEATKLGLQITVQFTQEANWLTWNKAVKLFRRTYCLYSSFFGLKNQRKTFFVCLKKKSTKKQIIFKFHNKFFNL